MKMITDRDHDVEINRANMYKALSLLYKQPETEMEETLNYLKGSIEKLNPQLVEITEEMENEFSSFKEDLVTLKVDHAKLFIGPADLLAPPYSSIYLDGERKVMGDSTIKAMAYYQEAGLEINSSFMDVPDHLAAELEFMYYLIIKSLNSIDNLAIKLQQSFLKNHLGLWVEKFTERVIERANTNYYRNLAVITKKIIDQEVQRFATI